MKSHLRRALVHMLLGLTIAILGLFLPRAIGLSILGLVTAVFVSIEFMRFRNRTVNLWFIRIYRPVVRHEEASRLTGASYLLIGSLLSFLIFSKEIASIAIAFMSVADPMAGIAGRKLGKTRLFGKSLEGDLACLFFAIITALVYYFAGVSVPLAAVLAGALAATTVEALSLPLNDNLTMPLVSGAIMTIIAVWI